MTWEAVTALSSLLSAVIVGFAAIAAIVQIRHLRLGNQLEAILDIYAQFNSREMTEARAFIEDELTETLPRDTDGRTSVADIGTLDPRVTMVANFHTQVGSLVVDGFLDERLVWRLAPVFDRVWRPLAPIAAAIRSERGYAMWSDFEYVAALRERITPDTFLSRYPAWFQQRLRAELAPLAERDSAARTKSRFGARS